MSAFEPKQTLNRASVTTGTCHKGGRICHWIEAMRAKPNQSWSARNAIARLPWNAADRIRIAAMGSTTHATSDTV